MTYLSTLSNFTSKTNDFGPLPVETNALPGYPLTLNPIPLSTSYTTTV